MAINMGNIAEFLYQLDSLLGGYPLLVIFITAFFLKAYLLMYLIKRKLIAKVHVSSIFLIGVLICTLFSDSAWIFQLINILFFNKIHLKIYSYYLRLVWASVI